MIVRRKKNFMMKQLMVICQKKKRVEGIIEITSEF